MCNILLSIWVESIILTGTNKFEYLCENFAKNTGVTLNDSAWKCFINDAFKLADNYKQHLQDSLRADVYVFFIFTSS